MNRTIRIKDLLDRAVLDEHGTRIGSGALIDRFQLTRWIFGRKPKPIVVPADQLDITRGSADCIFRRHGKAAD
jgi:hypothetical protein